MLFHDSKDESAWGLALVGVIVVTMAAILGTVTGNVQPKAPFEVEHTDVSSPDMHRQVPHAPLTDNTSPYHQPESK